LLSPSVGKQADDTDAEEGEGTLLGFAKVTRDLTERKEAEERIQQQSKEIMELSTPVMQVWQGVVVAPLIGSLDSQRTQQFMERLLNRIVETNSPLALVDIMGVPTVDTQMAQHLIETISAVRLLGAQVVLTGVRPAIAQTLVHLGIDLSGIITRSSLAAGLRVALDMLNLQVVAKNGKP
jgi:rsbT co-antagonist protein RsbR